jgi:preprotein translocase subunit SecB
MKSQIPSFSSLQLRNYHFTFVNIRANTKASQTAKVMAEQQVGFVPVEGQPNQWSLQLQLKLDSADQDNPFSYDMELMVVGIVEIISADIPVEKRESIAVVNGLGMLYGACREMVMNITARSVYGPCTLPSLNFATVLQEAIENKVPEPKTRIPEKNAAAG